MIAYARSKLREAAVHVEIATDLLDELFKVSMLGALNAKERLDIEAIPGIEHITRDLANALRAVANKEDSQ